MKIAASITRVLLMLCSQVFAQPVVKIQTDPAHQTLYLAIDREKATKLFAKRDRFNLHFQWTLTGPGSLKGDETSPGIFYIPPKVIKKASVEAVVTVTVTDAEGKTAIDWVTFTLSIPTLDDLMTHQLVTMAQDCLEVKHYTTPEALNAFDVCQIVLNKDPQNFEVRKILYTIVTYYKSRGDKWHDRLEANKNDKRAVEEAITSYERYNLVTKYTIEEFKRSKDSGVRTDVKNLDNDHKKIRRRLKELKDLQLKLSQKP